jgi:hypothetical protein
MNKFACIFKITTASSAADEQRLASQLFPTVLADFNLRTRIPGSPIPLAGTYVVIGVAAGYSPPDLELLDKIVEQVADRHADTVEFFDVSLLTSSDDLQLYIPGALPHYQTPIVALWTDGQLKLQLDGKSAREFLRNRYRKGVAQ